MSILIKGMEMPVIELEWTIRRGADGKWYAIDTNAETSDGEWHEIVPVPPHGDLIDRDRFRESVFIGEQCLYSWDELEDAIDYAPTIIPAEEESGCGRCDHCRINETGTCRYGEEETE